MNLNLKCKFKTMKLLKNRLYLDSKAKQVFLRFDNKFTISPPKNLVNWT